MLPELDLAALPPLAGLGILFVVAAIAGVINTIAGGGSLLILPALMGLGIAPSVANGTLRVGVVVQNVAAVIAFRRKGLSEHFVAVRLALPMMLGAAAGTGLATQLSDDLLRPVFGFVFAIWAVILVVRPGRFIDPPPQPATPRAGSYVLAVLVGIYGGFLQAGVGFPLLALLVSGLGYPPVRANAAKVMLVLAYTLVSLPMFAMAGQVAWREGIALACGAMLGGWLGTHWQVRSGASLVRWVVVITVAVSGVVMLIKGLTR